MPPNLPNGLATCCKIGIALAAAATAAIAQPLPDHTLPDPRFTPGAFDPMVTQDTIDSTSCVVGFTNSIRPPRRYTSELKRAQLDDPSRHYADTAMRDYEEDHLVPLEAGGSPTDPRNIWPEPLHGPWNAHTKDRLENRIHELICARVISLQTGRQAFQGDWTAAYRTYLAKGHRN